MNEMTDGFYDEPVAQTVAVEHGEPDARKEIKYKIISWAAAALGKIRSVPKKAWIIGAGAICAAAAAVIVVSLLGNTYKTPVSWAEKMQNSRSAEKLIALSQDSVAGFLGEDLETIMEVMQTTDAYEILLDYAIEQYDEGTVEDWIDIYGEDYKYTFEVEDKERLDRDDLKAYKSELTEIANHWLDAVERVGMVVSLDDFADHLGVSKAKARKFLSAFESVMKELKSADITDGYELSILITVDGEELDDPEEESRTMCVYKINGHWISEDILMIAISFAVSAIG